MLGRSRITLAGNAVEAFGEKGSERPARAVARKHVEVVNVQVGLAVRATHFRRIDEVEPVVGHHLSGNIENESAERVALIGVCIDAPVDLIEIFVDGAFDVDPARLASRAFVRVSR